MRKNLILFAPNILIGDILSIIGMVYYLLKYYKKIHIYINKEYNEPITYFQNYFRFDPLFNEKIFIIGEVENLINNGEYGEFDICNFDTSYVDLVNKLTPWYKPSFEFANLKNIDKKYYFNCENPFYNQLSIPIEHQTNPNTRFPLDQPEINHLIYYKLLGLNNSVRMEYFHYHRNLETEKYFSQKILNKYNLNIKDKYNIINCPLSNIPNEIYKYINNDYPCINISMSSPCIGYLISLVEQSESVHFIEGCNVNFFYHCQYKNIFQYDKNIYFHVWLRNRSWNFEKLDYAWKMMSEPILENWKFIF